MPEDPNAPGYLAGTQALVPCVVLDKIPVNKANGIITVERAAVLRVEEAARHWASHGYGECVVVTIHQLDGTLQFQAVPTKFGVEVDELRPLGGGCAKFEFALSGGVKWVGQ